MTSGKPVLYPKLGSFNKLPETVTVSGEKYKINTDFRVWIDISKLLKNSHISTADKCLSLIMLGYCTKFPKDASQAISALLDFYLQGRTNTKKASYSEPLIDFKNDEGALYAAFLQQYRIDLYKENLHWWNFLDLLSCLGENTEMVKIIGYRCAKPEKIKDVEKRRFLRKMKNRYRIKKDISDGELAEALI